MGLALKFSRAAVLALMLAQAGPSVAETVLTPQGACAALPEALRADCVAAGELLLDPAGMPQGDVDLTVSLRTENGALSAAYQRYATDEGPITCPASSTIVLPTGEDVYLHLTAIDAIYSFALPGHIDTLDLVPGRVEQRRLTTPAEAGETTGSLKTDADGTVAAIAVRFVAGIDALDRTILCADGR